MNRCVNIDWLQVFCAEPFGKTLDAAYYIRAGYRVEARAYGTPQYQEMFTVFEGDFPFIEVRRNPYSLKENGGIFNRRDCHLRLTNRACYSASPIDDLRRFLLAHDYVYKSISRIDICLDFNTFDRGDKPEKVLADYMENKISKINQCNIAAHGKDKWKGRVWNSLKWGSQNSMISTKLYCKSLELKEAHDKFYIRDQWDAAGLRQDIPVWRVEFSINSDLKAFVKLDTGELVSNKLTDYDTREKCLFRFHSLASKYFHFKYVEKMDNGKLRRKDRCKDKILFTISKDEQAYKPVPLTLQTEPNRTDKIIMRRLYQMQFDFNLPAREAEAINVIIHFFNRHMRFPLTSDELSKLILG